MSETLAALAALEATISALPNRARFPTDQPSRLLVDRLGAAETTPAIPSEAVLDVLRARLIKAGPSGFSRFSKRDLRDAPWVFWTGRRPTVLLPGLLDAVSMVAADSGRTLRNLIDAWIRDFSPDRPGVQETGARIRQLLATNRDLRLDQWRVAHQAVHLFDPERGPAEVAALVLKSDATVTEMLEQIGFGDPFRAVSGYLAAVQRELVPLAAQQIAGNNPTSALARALAFIAPENSLRFKEQKGFIAKGLLAPWLIGGRQPAEEIRDAVCGFLLQHLGDPRTRPGDWVGAGEDAVALMRGWLARASLTAFFDIVDDHAQDKHWKYRRAFWTACLDAGGIQDAWLALGNRVHSSARAVRDLNGAYGRMERASEQSVLLFRIGSLILCEWSHDGKLRAWPVDWKNAPELGKMSYTQAEVRGKGLPFPPNPVTGQGGAADGNGLRHIGSHYNYWQTSAAMLLAQRSSLRLRAADWRPR